MFRFRRKARARLVAAILAWCTCVALAHKGGVLEYPQSVFPAVLADVSDVHNFSQGRSKSLWSFANLLLVLSPAASSRQRPIASRAHRAPSPRQGPRVTRDEDGCGTLIIWPEDDNSHTASFIGPIHGLGDSNMGWADVAAHLHRNMPYVKFVLPNAPMSPVSINGGMSMPSWYDITSLDDKTGQTCEGIEKSRSAIVELVEEEMRKGIPPERIVIGGFSQGGALSIHTGLQFPKRLAGVLCLSGYLPREEAFELHPEAAQTPVAHFHGSDDPTVRIEWARQSAERLLKLGCNYELKEYAPLGHSASPEEIEDALNWLRQRLPPI